MAKKVVLFPEIVRVIKINIFSFKQKKHAQEKHAKETKENRKTKKTKKEKKEKVGENVVVAVNSICGKSKGIR